jgi:hypothetical protein
MRYAAGIPVLHFRRGIRHLSGQWQTAGEQTKAASHRVFARVLQEIQDVLARLRIPGGDTWRWQLPGALWLTTSLSILAAFIIAV